MITERIIGALAGLFSWLVAHLPAPSVPTWLSDIPGYVSTVTAFAGSLSAWIPVGLMATVLAAWGASYVVALIIRVTRMVASFGTGGGGSVA